jgi:16S rRNA (adenine1518-N6/adenine1519-N6)-dimethyltransferase
VSDRLTPLERLRQSGVTPDRALGQNFLIDPNILDVIERMAGLSQEDVILEVGPGAGVLTERLIERCGFVHSVEVDRRLAALLEAQFAVMPNFSLHEADAVRLPLGSLDPAPTKFVANLPYNVATPLVIKSLEELPALRLWCLMVQREIADRLFARPGSAAYGGVSVMTQLMTRKLAARAVPDTVFYPRPRIRSSLLAFARRDDAAGFADRLAAIKAVVYCSFSHRRKTLVNSLAGAEARLLPPALAGLAPPQRKQLAQELLAGMGLAANIRPQQLTPEQYARLEQAFAQT